MSKESLRSDNEGGDLEMHEGRNVQEKHVRLMQDMLRDDVYRLIQLPNEGAQCRRRKPQLQRGSALTTYLFLKLMDVY